MKRNTNEIAKVNEKFNDIKEIIKNNNKNMDMTLYHDIDPNRFNTYILEVSNKSRIKTFRVYFDAINIFLSGLYKRYNDYVMDKFKKINKGDFFDYI